MHHGKHFRRLNRTSSHRNAMLRNMVSSLIEHGRIETTVPKAKELKPIADAMITLGKKGDVNAKRQAIAYLNTRDVTIPKLFDELAPRFANRQGGYTRIQRMGNRYGDNAPMAVIEYIDGPTDLKKEMVTKTLARIFSEKEKVTVKEILEGSHVESLGLSKSLVRDLKKVQFSNSIEAIDQAIEKEMASRV
ncbi:ribosomal protein L17 [Radiomyces spectabilis]|uniref:ribosomal protein L17 n=1 Tax=Radiomyces spectabilis TaxID=64574 RepID=UPI0022204A50|nr:ribosomal protein L17 [Radiomyces spectabilis]KAI8384665.1 ribosomal protein L17 [Radiomyces spectabilis]